MSLFLIKDLALSFWKPTEDDLTLLSNWLLEYAPSTVENVTGRFIIRSLNWDFDAGGELFLPFSFHCQVSFSSSVNSC